jgi:hypothetical protein
MERKKYSLDFMIDTKVRCFFTEDLEKCQEWTGKEVPMIVIKSYFPHLRDGLRSFEICRVSHGQDLYKWHYSRWHNSHAKDPDNITFLEDNVIRLDYYTDRYNTDSDFGLFVYEDVETSSENFEEFMSLYKRRLEILDEVEEAYEAKQY